MMEVECQELQVRAGETALLDGVNLAFEAPALVGILGPNGAGKSTLLRCLAGYRNPDHGKVLWNGRPLSSWTALERGSACGYCPQQFAPAWDYSVAEIVALGRDRKPIGAPAIDETLQEYGVEPLAQRRWSQLSGGERARTMLTATLAIRPPLVLADEPGASLDMRHRLELMQRLRTYSRMALVIVVMHDIDLALRFCDRLVLLDDGRVVADEPPSDLLDAPAFEAAFSLRLQTENRRADRDWVIGVD